MTATALRTNMIMVFKQELHPPEKAELLPPDAYYLAERMLADDWPDNPADIILDILLLSRGPHWLARGMRPVGEGDVIAIRGRPYILGPAGTDIPLHKTLKYKEHWKWQAHLTASGSIPSSP